MVDLTLKTRFGDSIDTACSCVPRLQQDEGPTLPQKRSLNSLFRSRDFVLGALLQSQQTKEEKRRSRQRSVAQLY